MASNSKPLQLNSGFIKIQALFSNQGTDKLKQLHLQAGDFFFPNAFCLKTNCAKLLIALLFFIKEHTLYTQRNHLENIYIF